MTDLASKARARRQAAVETVLRAHDNVFFEAAPVRSGGRPAAEILASQLTAMARSAARPVEAGAAV